jgi:hypothetical protein
MGFGGLAHAGLIRRKSPKSFIYLEDGERSVAQVEPGVDRFSVLISSTKSRRSDALHRTHALSNSRNALSTTLDSACSARRGRSRNGGGGL